MLRVLTPPAIALWLFSACSFDHSGLAGSPGREDGGLLFADGASDSEASQTTRDLPQDAPAPKPDRRDLSTDTRQDPDLGSDADGPIPDMPLDAEGPTPDMPLDTAGPTPDMAPPACTVSSLLATKKSPSRTVIEATAECTSQATPEYRFFYRDLTAGTTHVLGSDYSPAAQYDWNTSGLLGSYSYGVFVRAQGKASADDWKARSIVFP